jgi:hypothetical protein
MLLKLKLRNGEEKTEVKETDVVKKINIFIRVLFGDSRLVVRIKLTPVDKIEKILDYVSKLIQTKKAFIALFNKSEKLDLKKSIGEKDIKHNSTLLALFGQFEPKSFMRFKTLSTSGWSYSRTAWDAITFKPKSPILVSGFSNYGPYTEQTEFEFHYKVQIDDKEEISS